MDPLEFPTVLALDFPFSFSCSRLPSYGGWRERERERERRRLLSKNREKLRSRECSYQGFNDKVGYHSNMGENIKREGERRSVCVHVIEERNVVGLGGREGARKIERERETTLSNNRKKERLRECSCHSKLVIRRLLKEKERAGLPRRPSCSEERVSHSRSR